MAVAAVQVATTQESHNTGAASATQTGAVTVTAGANLLVVFTHADTAGATGVTYNGTALTKLGSKVGTFYATLKCVDMWYLASPPTGSSYNVVATWPTSRQDYGFTWATFSGYSSFGTFYSNSSPLNSTSANGTVTISDWASGDYSVGSILVNLQTITSGDIAMGNYIAAANNDNYVNSEYQTADGNLNWTHAADVWAACGCAIKGSSVTFIAPAPYIKRQAINRASTY